jgi:cytochrome c biogenesis protein CcdA
MALLLLSFFAGALTILSPCVLPMLPIIVGGSIAEKDTKIDKWRPVIITLSLALSVIIFTLILRATTALIDIPREFWAAVSGIIIIFFGIITLFPNMWEWLSEKLKLSQKSNKALANSGQKKGRLGAVFVGLSLGPVFSSCSPTYAIILATVLPQNFAVGLANLIAYALGLSLVLLLIAIFGQRLIAKLTWAADPSGWFKRTLGVLFLIVGIAILFGFDKQFEAYVLENSTFIFNIINFESGLLQEVR